MFFKPLKFDQIVVSPPREIKEKAHQIFDRILQNYNKNYAKFRPNPLANPLNDPWHRREAWRWDPFFSKQNMLRKSFPGLGIGAAAFAIYLAYDTLIINKDDKKEH